MAAGLYEGIKQLVQDMDMPEELIKSAIEEFLVAAYKRTFKTADNAVVVFSEDGKEVSLFAKKIIVEHDEVYEDVKEIDIEDALVLNKESEIGDEILIEIDPKEFDRASIQTAKQRAKQIIGEIKKNSLYSEYKQKEGEMIVGYCQRIKNDNIYVDLGKFEGVLLKKYQSPREIYNVNDRIKALLYEVKAGDKGVQVVLSRTHPEFVQKLFELEVPEIYDQTVVIERIVRDPGYRTKMAVSSRRDDIDPVGACVGMKGVRIQSVVKELEGEKVDVLQYHEDPKTFIKNALLPAEIETVFILDEDKKNALVVVKESQLSLAIGKQGQNVRLANRLVDWNIEVKTIQQFQEMDIASESKKAAFDLFDNNDSYEDNDEIVSIRELPGIPAYICEILENNDVNLIETVVNMDENDLRLIKGLGEEDIATLLEIINENVDIIEEEEYEDDEYEEEYYCPECNSVISLDMTTCPNCGVGISFEEEEE
ncbi:MAG: transcription termination/antitermination protein NusA [Spirochaetales bacterium]|nr:transcription termination/antitermination protein NusA [Spirochaetales bacterium]